MNMKDIPWNQFTLWFIIKYITLVWCFHETFVKKRVGVNFRNFHSATHALYGKILSHQTNSLVISLLSRIFCNKSVKVNLLNFHTVLLSSMNWFHGKFLKIFVKATFSLLNGLPEQLVVLGYHSLWLPILKIFREINLLIW